MAKFIRYALATVCFAASVGCLALWLGKISSQAAYLSTTWFVQLETEGGTGSIILNDIKPARPNGDWRFNVFEQSEPWFADEFERQGSFGTGFDFVYFPLWYPALIFALAGVAALRFRRQFSIRSALVAVTFVAALLGMIVAL